MHRERCAEKSLLEIWDYDRSTIANLSKTDIVEAINTVTESPVFGNSVDYTDLLGETVQDSRGKVVKAKAIRSVFNMFGILKLILGWKQLFRQLWYTEWDPSKVEYETNLVSVDFERADNFTMQWEAAAIRALADLSEATTDYGVFFQIMRR